MGKTLFYIAIIPSESICKEILDFKQHTVKHFDSKKALRSPAHITLQPPFRWNIHNLDPIRKNLTAFVKKHEPFETKLKDFKAFPPRVIFIDVVLNPDLIHLHHSLLDNMEEHFGLVDRRKNQFEPHITIAYKDLQKTIFPRAWKHFSKIQYRRSFTVEAITLLKYNPEGLGERKEQVWEIFEEFRFGNH